MTRAKHYAKTVAIMNGTGVRLRVEDISLAFGGVQALDGVSFEVREQEILAIIGPNGAGKTCILNCVSGFYRPQSGRTYFDGRDIARLSSHKIAELGVARTFQNIALYTGLSTIDNLLAGRHIRSKSGAIGCAIYFGKTHQEEVKQREVVEDIINFLELEPVRKEIVGSLPYGLRKKTDLGRALAMEPKVLLLDEPMAGMNLEEKEDMARYIIDIYEGQSEAYPNNPTLRDGVSTIVLIEHDMGVVMDIADRVIVLDFGKKIAEGTPAEIKGDERVIKAYLGRKE